MARILRAAREQVLSRWLEAARLQPFHAAHPEGAVADHIPALFDALVAFLGRNAPPEVDPSAPLDDPAVHAAAQAHARARFAQGLSPVDVLTEFRLLRQEIGHALRERAEGVGDGAAAELLVHDALDGAMALALTALEAYGAERRDLARQREVLMGALQLRSELVQQAHEAIFSWEADGAITFWNRGAEELYGFTADEALGRRSHDLLRTPAEQVATFMSALEQDQRWEGELVHTNRLGQELVVEGRMALIVQEGRRHVLEATRNVSDRRRAENERTLLLDAVAHDLRTPLAIIKGSADLLQRQAANGRVSVDGLAKRTAAIDNAVASISSQIGELLDLARLRAGEPLDLAWEPTDLVALAERVADRYREPSSQHAVDVDSAVPELVGEWDAVRLERVLDNLLGNAVKYTPGRGAIRVEVRREGTNGHSWATVSVRDSGIGIPSADLPRVFERYHRGTNVVGRYAGEGIGLAGARQIVEQHGGTISAESEKGKGATFTIRLPLARSKAVSHE